MNKPSKRNNRYIEHWGVSGVLITAIGRLSCLIIYNWSNVAKKTKLWVLSRELGWVAPRDNWQCLDTFNVFHNWVDAIDIWFVEAGNPTMQLIAPIIKNYSAQSIKQG